jgi:hypothetical protein
MSLSRPLSTGPTAISVLRSWLSAAILVLLLPFAILLIGLPVALAIRGVVDGLRWIASLLL